jgi:hypothetical protein
MYLIRRALFVISIFLFCFGVLWTRLWPCPRCRKPYATTLYTNFPFLDKCRYPHLHFLVTEGGADEAGLFHKIDSLNDDRLAEIFTRDVLAEYESRYEKGYGFLPAGDLVGGVELPKLRKEKH